jgi:glyoxylate reductase
MNVLITGRLPENMVDRIKAEHRVVVNPEDRPMSGADILAAVGDADGMLCTIADRIDSQVIRRGRKLKIIANYGVGFNHIDLGAARERGITVTNTPGVLTDSTAELTMALLLSVARRVVAGDQVVRSGGFNFWAPFTFLGTEVTGKTLGIIGLGRIGRAVAERAAGFRMRILYHNRRRLAEAEEHRLGVSYASFDQLLAGSDFVSLHVPLTPETHHLIDAGAIDKMRSTAYLINTSRGPAVDEGALVAALKNGKIKGAGLDVYEDEPDLAPGLVDLPSVVLLPHVGSATTETRTRMAEMAVNNLLAGLRGDRPPNAVPG